ncbi:MAG: NHL repeat-containing protein [Candidatus Dormibacteria bacterium]
MRIAVQLRAGTFGEGPGQAALLAAALVLLVATLPGAPQVAASGGREGPACTAQVRDLCVVAGTTPGRATSSELDRPYGVAVDAAGNLYIADSGRDVVERVTPSGRLSVVAGDGRVGKPTPGRATSSELEGPSGLAVDGSGNLYIADNGNNMVEKVTPSGTLSVAAGLGQAGGAPNAVAEDADGNLFIASIDSDEIEEVTASGQESVVAGTDRPGAPTPGPATSSRLGEPYGVAVDAAGNLYIADTDYNVVAKVTHSGTLSVVAGTGRSGLGAPVPGPATSAALGLPEGLAVDAAGNLYIADFLAHVVEKVTPSGMLAVVAGTGTLGAPTPGPATSSDLGTPTAVAVDAAGDLYIADADNNVVEKVTPSGLLSVVAGTAKVGLPAPRPAIGSQLDEPGGVAVGADGNLYITDADRSVVEQVTPSGTLSVAAGSGRFGQPTPGPATSSDLDFPSAVAVDAVGDLYIADTANDVVERVSRSGTLSVVAGTGDPGKPTPGPATSSELGHPSGVAVDAAGNVYIADSGNDVIEKVTPSGTLSVVAGTGDPGKPTPGPATGSDLSDPLGVAVDAAGHVYIADTGNDVVEKVTTSGMLSVVAGTGDQGAPTPGPATNSHLSGPGGVTVDAAGNLYIADSGNGVVEKVTRSGVLSVVAGTGDAGAPTAGPATSSDLTSPWAVAVDAAGDIYITDSDNSVVEMVAESVGTSTPAGSAMPLLVGVGVAIVLVAGILGFLLSRRRRRSAGVAAARTH